VSIHWLRSAADGWRSAPGREGGDPAVGPALPGHRPIEFEFTGKLEDVPVDAAAALARVVRWWLRHADQHEAHPPAAHIALSRTRLSLAVIDPECSPTCLSGVGAPADTSAARPPSELLAGRLSLCRSEDGGLSLDWGLDPRRDGAVTRRHR
jgi:hypothetical protein